MNALATLNDQFRKSWREVVFTSGIINGVSDHFGLAPAVESFCLFDEDNDPYGEHDFGSLELEGQRILWKIDYYDQALQYWCDPLDTRCRRVLTVLLAGEY